jgi:alpha-ketoglutarate-dependent taurine dioxygenase
LSIEFIDFGRAGVSTATETDVQQGGVTVRPLQPTIGAEIGGVDLRSPLNTSDRDQIKAAILRYNVVFFRDQPQYADL